MKLFNGYQTIENDCLIIRICRPCRIHMPLSGMYEIEERCTVDKFMFKIAGFSGPVDHRIKRITDPGSFLPLSCQSSRQQKRQCGKQTVNIAEVIVYRRDHDPQPKRKTGNEQDQFLSVLIKAEKSAKDPDPKTGCRTEQEISHRDLEKSVRPEPIKDTFDHPDLQDRCRMDIFYFRRLDDPKIRIPVIDLGIPVAEIVHQQ